MPFRLLVADDSATIQRVIQLSFADEDVQIVAVGDGDQAIARLEAEDLPHLVLADADMPGKNGYDLTRHIKQSPRLAHIPVVLLTGALESSQRASEAGCDGILSKPFEPQTMIATVRELLNRAVRASPPPAEAVPTLADAFAALLDAEQRGSPASAHAIWPAAAEPAVVTDDLIEDVVRRVIERLPDGVVRETVKDVVAGVAERLVHEEIDRIKAAIR